MYKIPPTRVRCRRAVGAAKEQGTVQKKKGFERILHTRIYPHSHNKEEARGVHGGVDMRCEGVHAVLYEV